MENHGNGVFAPNYCGSFKCIADNCRHSCCVDWEICIDSETALRYKQTDSILKTLTDTEDGPCFTLRSDGRCPHLNDNGLCDIIISYGEEYLCEICREHPRFYNYLGGGRTEMGLGLVCEEACRLILQNELPFSLVKTGDAEAEESYDFSPLAYRKHIFSVIESEGSFDGKINLLKNEFSVPAVCSLETWVDRFSTLEILDESWRELLKSAGGEARKSSDGFDKYYCRLLTYFVYRHVSAAMDEYNLRARLGFAILSAEMIRFLFEKQAEQSFEVLSDISRRYSAEIEYSEDNTEELICAFEKEMI